MSFTPPSRAPDYTDSFSGPLAPTTETARELMTRALLASPRWFRNLFDLRQRLARLAGLKTDIGNNDESLSALLSMPLIIDTPEHFVSGTDDKHLDFTLAVQRTDTQVTITTNIWFNHPSGRLYLTVIKPVHRKIIAFCVRQLGAIQ